MTPHSIRPGDFRAASPFGRPSGPGGFLRLDLLAALVAIAVIVGVGVFLIRHFNEEPAPTRTAAAKPGVFMLPMKGIDAAALLTQPRDTVRATLGAVTTPAEGTDTFDLGIEVVVRYASDRANGIVVRSPQADMNVGPVRRWLKLPPSGPIVLGGRIFHVRSGGQDSDEVVLEEAPPEQAVRGTSLRRSSDLLRAFPSMPAGLAFECGGRTGGVAGEVICQRNADARLVYDLGVSGAGARSLIVLDPPATGSREECRAFLRAAVPEAQPVAQMDHADRIVDYFSRGSVRYTATWQQRTTSTRAGCAIQACRGEGENPEADLAPCTPPEKKR